MLREQLCLLGFEKILEESNKLKRFAPPRSGKIKEKGKSKNTPNLDNKKGGHDE